MPWSVPGVCYLGISEQALISVSSPCWQGALRGGCYCNFTSLLLLHFTLLTATTSFHSTLWTRFLKGGWNDRNDLSIAMIGKEWTRSCCDQELLLFL